MASSSTAAARLSHNREHRIQQIIACLCKPYQLELVQKARLVPYLNDSATTTTLDASEQSELDLLHAQARTRGYHIEWDSGCTELKQLAKSDPRVISVCLEHMRQRFQAHQAASRLLALYLIDMLFVRSKQFRELFVEWMHEFLRLGTGLLIGQTVHALDELSGSPSSSSLRSGLSAQARLIREACVARLPKPEQIARVLFDQTTDFVIRWTVRFGVHYSILAIGCAHMRDQLRLPDAQEQRAEDDRRALAAAADRERSIALQYERVLREWPEQQPALSTLLDEMSNAFELLFPSIDAWEDETRGQHDDDDDDDNDNDDDDVEDDMWLDEEPEEVVSRDVDVDDSSAASPHPFVSNLDAATSATDRDEVLRSTNLARLHNAGAALELDDDELAWYALDAAERAAGEEQQARVAASARDSVASSNSDSNNSAAPSSLRDNALMSSSYSLDITIGTSLVHRENATNTAMFDALRECATALRKEWLPRIAEWQRVLDQFDVGRYVAAETDRMRVRVRSSSAGDSIDAVDAMDERLRIDRIRADHSRIVNEFAQASERVCAVCAQCRVVGINVDARADPSASIVSVAVVAPVSTTSPPSTTSPASALDDLHIRIRHANRAVRSLLARRRAIEAEQRKQFKKREAELQKREVAARARANEAKEAHEEPDVPLKRRKKVATRAAAAAATTTPTTSKHVVGPRTKRQRHD